MRISSMVAVWLAATILLVGCSGSSSIEEDSLKGVSDSTAADLCGQFAAARKKSDTGRETMNPPVIARASTDYRTVAAAARSAGATKFATLMDKTAKIAETVAKGSAPTGTGSVSDLLEDVRRLEMYQTSAQASCAMHSHP